MQQLELPTFIVQQFLQNTNLHPSNKLITTKNTARLKDHKMKERHNKSWTFILQFRCEERAERMNFDQTGSGVQQAFHSMSTRGFFPQGVTI